MRRRGKKNSNQIKFMLFTSLSLLCILTVGYAAFSTNLNLSARGNIGSKELTPNKLKGKYCNTASGDGLYADTHEEGRCIYKGESPDNYITFNNELWRIMSVESDNTIKIIRNESIGNRAWDTTGGTYGSNNWKRPANLNTYLNSEYLGTIKEDFKYIIDHNFNVGTPGNNTDTEDIVTDVAQEAQITWNGKIGLMTITEILKTTSNTTCTSLKVAYNSDSTGYCNTNNWLWPKSGYLWTISPYSVGSGRVWDVASDGYVYGDYADLDDGGVLPVLYLTSNIQLEGEGTSGSPYTIVS